MNLCILYAFGKGRSYAEFAMMGRTIKQTTTQNNSVIHNERDYVCTDGDNYHGIKEAVIIDQRTKKADY
ncbi:hypothetical protein [Mycoplasma marinum]|uniref:hypothetical protein n=1 Tax=Mycoplasma marinum TaxID=1937190 RepID=UPI0010403721|nr:hypothetical protein [Mycoplasma marinum]